MHDAIMASVLTPAPVTLGGLTLQVLTQLSPAAAQAHANVKHVVQRLRREDGEYHRLKNITQTQANTNTWKRSSMDPT